MKVINLYTLIVIISTTSLTTNYYANELFNKSSKFQNISCDKLLTIIINTNNQVKHLKKRTYLTTKEVNILDRLEQYRDLIIKERENRCQAYMIHLMNFDSYF